MIILGKTNDDKGTQLENLTRQILTSMGCKNVEVNVVGSGGEEIDVVADYPLPSIGNIQQRRLICECKAYTRPVDIPQWLKFLGKIYSEEAQTNSEVLGCFIALSGVNGNVSGHYDKLKSPRPNIMLVKGDTLLEEVKKIYELCGVEKVNEVVGQFTNRRYRSLEVAYYEQQVYWIIIFEGESYTILDSKGIQVKNELLESLKILVENSLPVQTYVGLEEEAKAHRRNELTKKSVICQVIAKNGSVKKSELISEGDFNFASSKFQQAITELIKEGQITESEDNTEISLQRLNDNNFYTYLTKLFLFLLKGEIGVGLVDVLKSSFFAIHINEKFVAEIQSIQGDLPLSSSEVQNAVKILKWSPSAILWAIQPDEMLIKHRNDPDFKNKEEINGFGRNYFFGQIYSSLRNDLAHPLARAYLIDNFNIREIETRQKILIKGGTGIELESELHERLGIGYLADDLTGPDGSNTILMLMIASAPEPWDVPAWSNQNTVNEEGDNVQN